MVDGFEYVTVQIGSSPGRPHSDALTVGINNVSQHGWRLIAPPSLFHKGIGTEPSIYMATFERPKAWVSDAQ
ncbi:hypothetical protein GCM10023068_28300 [Leifsonia shinshuensis]